MTTTHFKIFHAAGVDALERRVNDWIVECEEDEHFQYEIVQMHMATYPGSSTSIALLVNITPVSEEARARSDTALLARLLARQSNAPQPSPTPGLQYNKANKAKADRLAPFDDGAMMTAQEQMAKRDAEDEANRKDCGCYPDEMCFKCDNGVPLNPVLATLVSLPEEVARAAELEREMLARAVGADDEAMELYTENRGN
jgi:hypothetical protein